MAIRPNTNSRAAHTRISRGSEPVRGSPLLPDEPPDDEPPDEEPPDEEPPLDAANVNGNDAVVAAPVIVSVWAPGSRLVGITTDAVTLPVLSAAAVPSVTVAEWTAIVTDSPGTNPVALTVNCCPPASVALAATGLPDASTTLTEAPPDAVVVVILPLDCDVVEVVEPAPVVEVVLPTDVEVVLPEPADVDVVDPPATDVVVELAPAAVVVGGPLLETLHVTPAGVSDEEVEIVICRFQ